MAQCPNGCAAPMETRRLERIFRRGTEPVVVADLEIEVCPDCGEEVLPLASARKVEAVLDGSAAPAGRFTAPLYKTA